VQTLYDFCIKTVCNLYIPGSNRHQSYFSTLEDHVSAAAVMRFTHHFTLPVQVRGTRTWALNYSSALFVGWTEAE
jgi:hypothetical protein